MLSGLRDPAELASGAPRMDSLDTEPLALEGVELLQVFCEAKSDRVQQLLPPALHPTLPGVVQWLVYRCPSSPWGPFQLAQTRVECRSGTRPRAFLVSGAIDNERARAELAARWGYALLPGEVRLQRGYDEIRASVHLGGAPALELCLRDPTPIDGEVVQFIASVQGAHTPRGFRLVQVDPDYEVARAERGEPSIEEFAAELWGEERVEPLYPISAVFCLANVTLPALRYLSRADVAAFQGTERV